MNNELQSQIPFKAGDWIIDTKNPGRLGQYTGKFHQSGPHILVELRFPDGSLKSRPLIILEPAPQTGAVSIEDRLKTGRFGKSRDLQRLITFEKLKGTLHEVVYSMEAAQIDFYPYQFKPVLKFINSPTERLIIADEVGLGKTIESALIWTELQARRRARRMLVVCPRILREKWRDELRGKFLLDAKIIDFPDLLQEIQELEKVGPDHEFVLIASYSGLRSPRAELKLLGKSADELGECSEKTRFLSRLQDWNSPYPPFDLVVFDEAHYMRNPGSSTFHLGRSIASHGDTGVLCVSATPVNNSNIDLHSLLRLIDQDFFETQGMFQELLNSNRPSVQTINALTRIPPDFVALEQAVAAMGESPFIKESPLFSRFRSLVEQIGVDPDNNSLVTKAQDTAEKLNLLGGYINRTRRVQVQEGRSIRQPNVVNVDYTSEEMSLYNTILEFVRLQCRLNKNTFHIFRVLGLQLRAASCLPVIATEIRDGLLVGTREESSELLSEGIGEELTNDSDNSVSSIDMFQDGTLLPVVSDYDFEANDSKFKKLVELLTYSDDEKLVIFSFYRKTLAYLGRRLQAEGVGLATIHGGIHNDERWNLLEKFRDPNGPRVLLSSEVGSEGIDLQFCRTVVNYDLPWNPMRIEQRIGRIDRVGQKAEVLSIINFKVNGTVEERLYERLHKKLLVFASSLGDLEAIIGEQVKQLTVDLLSQDLTPEQEAFRIAQTETAIKNQLLEIQRLEESGDSLVALSDYVQTKISQDRERGRYVQPEELEDYLSDFFEREFPRSGIDYDTPVQGCMRLRLSPEACDSLHEFVRDDRSLSARPLRANQFSITFRREVHERLPLTDKRRVHFVNHLSPLIRWITNRNRDGVHTFYNVSALQLVDNELSEGDYLYLVDRWAFKGLTKREQMAFAVIRLGDSSPLEADQSELSVQNLLRNGRDWDYPKFNREGILDDYKRLQSVLQKRFGEALTGFEAENGTAVQIRVQRAINHWDRLIDQSKKAIETMKNASREESMVRGRETRLKNELANKQRKIDELNRGLEIDFESETLAAGIFRVVRN